MQDNKDPKIVVMDVDMFHRLTSLASIGANESGQDDIFKEIKRHVRRFNEGIRDDIARQKLAEEKRLTLAGERVNKILSRTRVWVLIAPGMYAPGTPLRAGGKYATNVIVAMHKIASENAIITTVEKEFNQLMLKFDEEVPLNLERMPPGDDWWDRHGCWASPETVRLASGAAAWKVASAKLKDEIHARVMADRKRRQEESDGNNES